MLEKLDAKLVDGWRKSYKWLSMQLAGLTALAAVFFSEYPAALLTAIQWWLQVPAEYRTVIGPVGGVALLAMIALARLWQQHHPSA